MNSHHLEDWAYRAAQTLQDFVDAAQEAAGDPDGDGELQDVRDLLRELDDTGGLPSLRMIGRRQHNHLAATAFACGG